jgi:hypothetical protein
METCASCVGMLLAIFFDISLAHHIDVIVKD